MLKKKLIDNISLKSIHLWLILVMILMSGIVVYSTFLMASAFRRLTEAEEHHHELEKAAYELMDASDYLTESAQRFTVNGEIEFLNRYFQEAFEANRREEALLKMGTDEKAQAAFEQLQEAMANSVKLMEREYYAMRLVIEAKGYTDYPGVLDGVVLDAEDLALSPDDMMRRATELVLDNEYYEQKDNIRRDMRESIAEVDKMMQSVEDTELAILRRHVGFVQGIIIIQIVFLFVMVRLTSIMGINPLLRAVDRIREDEPIREVGAKEFRFLARAYNKMYDKNKNSLENLSFKASHDELTGAYNRAGYDILMNSMDLESTYMLMMDLDNFKGINDNYGHEVGDKVLIKLVRVLKKVFREEDYICRIGGDEFVVFMVRSGGIPRRLIESKIEEINSCLGQDEEGLPPISVSVGIVSGRDASDPVSLYEKTDAAMYESKKRGKHTYTFYSEA